MERRQLALQRILRDASRSAVTSSLRVQFRTSEIAVIGLRRSSKLDDLQKISVTVNQTLPADRQDDGFILIMAIGKAANIGLYTMALVAHWPHVLDLC